MAQVNIGNHFPKQVKIQEGTITIQIKDAEGNVIFKESNILHTISAALDHIFNQFPKT